VHLRLLTVVLATAGVLAKRGPAAAAALPPDSTASSAWTVQGPTGGRWVLRWGNELEITVAAGDQPLRNVRLAGSTLQSVETGAPLRVGRLQLCRVDPPQTPPRRAAVCTPPPEIAAGNQAVFALRLEPKSVPAGIYTGAVLLAADGGTGVKTVELRVEKTTVGEWGLGGIAIAAGVLLGWLLTVFLRQLNARATAKLPASLILDGVEELRTQVKAASQLTEVPFPTLATQFKAREEALKLSVLEGKGFIPPAVPNPFAASPDNTAAYQQYLTEQGTRVRALEVIVRLGIGYAVARWPDAPNRQPIKKALARLDAAASTHTEPAAAEAAVRQILADMRNELGDPPGMLKQEEAGGAAMPPVREVQLQIQRVSLLGWGLTTLVTILAGLVVLVVTNYGFGTLLDYIKCVFWGLGLPIAGQQLQQLTPSSIYTIFRVPTVR
jgi:hypothetical protein